MKKTEGRKSYNWVDSGSGCGSETNTGTGNYRSKTLKNGLPVDVDWSLVAWFIQLLASRAIFLTRLSLPSNNPKYHCSSKISIFFFFEKNTGIQKIS
jgi:hypothetical protein